MAIAHLYTKLNNQKATLTDQLIKRLKSYPGGQGELYVVVGDEHLVEEYRSKVKESSVFVTVGTLTELLAHNLRRKTPLDNDHREVFIVETSPVKDEVLRDFFREVPFIATEYTFHVDMASHSALYNEYKDAKGFRHHSPEDTETVPLETSGQKAKLSDWFGTSGFRVDQSKARSKYIKETYEKVVSNGGVLSYEEWLVDRPYLVDEAKILYPDNGDRPIGLKGFISLWTNAQETRVPLYMADEGDVIIHEGEQGYSITNTNNTQAIELPYRIMESNLYAEIIEIQVYSFNNDDKFHATVMVELETKGSGCQINMDYHSQAIHT